MSGQCRPIWGLVFNKMGEKIENEKAYVLAGQQHDVVSLKEEAKMADFCEVCANCARNHNVFLHEIKLVMQASRVDGKGHNL